MSFSIIPWPRTLPCLNATAALARGRRGSSFAWIYARIPRRGCLSCRYLQLLPILATPNFSRILLLLKLSCHFFPMSCTLLPGCRISATTFRYLTQYFWVWAMKDPLCFDFSTIFIIPTLQDLRAWDGLFFRYWEEMYFDRSNFPSGRGRIPKGTDSPKVFIFIHFQRWEPVTLWGRGCRKFGFSQVGIWAE